MITDDVNLTRPKWESDQPLAILGTNQMTFFWGEPVNIWFICTRTRLLDILLSLAFNFNMTYIYNWVLSELFPNILY